MTTALRELPKGLVVLDGRLHVVRSNPAARQLCASWSRAEEPDRRATRVNQVRVPTAIADACRSLRHEWELALHVTSDAGLGAAAGYPRNGALPVRLDHDGLPGSACACRAKLRRRASPFCVWFPVAPVSPVLRNVTAAERDVALILAEGLSNQEIADRLGKTVHAVKFLLHRIYRKTKVPSRARLIAILRGRPSEPS